MYSPTKQNMEVRMGINKKKHIIYGTRKLIITSINYKPKIIDSVFDKHSHTSHLHQFQ